MINIQKIHLIKDRKIILKRVLELCRMKIDITKIAIVALIKNDIIDFYIFCDEKYMKKFTLKFFEFQTFNCGRCVCYIKSFESLRSDLIYNRSLENSWSDVNCLTILDLSHKYKNIIENPNKKSIWCWFKNLF